MSEEKTVNRFKFEYAIILVNIYRLAIERVIGIFDSRAQALDYQIKHDKEWKGLYHSYVTEYNTKVDKEKTI